MSPEQMAVKLRDISDRIASAKLLAAAANMATESLEPEHHGALSELLDTIVERLRDAVMDLERVQEAA